MQKTEFINNQAMETVERVKCHGGEGIYKCKDLISSMDKANRLYIKFIHDCVLLPGTTFANHMHESGAPLEEWYYCLSGKGVMNLDGTDYDFLPGDICVCRANGTHGLVNNSGEDLHIVVIYASPIEGQG
jgi:mannose-6-phosphate isomerase-like protein (cupin superfamily)